jgi:ABC-2 type transport system ATP-binding protein
MKVLTVEGLGKRYQSFELKDVSFALEEGRIAGFIGRNGAGKTTTIKSLLNFVHPDSGRIEFFGKDFRGHELEIKQRIGYLSGGVDYYPRKRLRAITEVTRRFYEAWDEAAYRRYLAEFALDEAKTPAQLSEGMKVKYSLALALSHGARLLVLDEPTSGLDPVSRDELLEVFLDLCDGGVTILFSTHITSDLDKCADDIVYIKEGKIRAAGDMKGFLASYRLVALPEGRLEEASEALLVGPRRAKEGRTALVAASDAPLLGLPSSEPDLEAIMLHLDKE